MDNTTQQMPGSTSTPDVVAEFVALSKKAADLRSAAIRQLLAERARIEENLKILGYHDHPNGNGTTATRRNLKEAIVDPKRPSKRFEGMTLAQVGEILLREHAELHGTEIEKKAKAGGYTGGTAKFQNYLPVALKRDGRFINVGGNTWKLKEEDSE